MLNDSFFIKTAELLSSYSNCVSFKVGAVIVKDKRIITTGYNGSPAGKTNCCDVFDKDNFDREEHHKWSEINEIHAEMNAIMYAASANISIKDAIMYVTHHPCDNCLKHIINTGIKKIVYLHDYDKRNLNNPFLSCIEIVKFNDIHEDVIKDDDVPAYIDIRDCIVSDEEEKQYVKNYLFKKQYKLNQFINKSKKPQMFDVLLINDIDNVINIYNTTKLGISALDGYVSNSGYVCTILNNTSNSNCKYILTRRFTKIINKVDEIDNVLSNKYIIIKNPNYLVRDENKIIKVLGC